MLVLDGDPLGTDADATGNARGWAAKRTPDSHGHMSRVYAFESILSVTGANADERHTVSAADFPALAAAFEAAISGGAGEAPSQGWPKPSPTRSKTSRRPASMPWSWPEPMLIHRCKRQPAA